MTSDYSAFVVIQKGTCRSVVRQLALAHSLTLGCAANFQQFPLNDIGLEQLRNQSLFIRVSPNGLQGGYFT